MAISLLSGVPFSVHKNDKKCHFWTQAIVILEPIWVEIQTIPQNDHQSVYYSEPRRIFVRCNYLMSRAI